MNWKADPQKGLWLIPSRARPHRLKRLVEALRATSCSTPGMVLIQKHEVEKYAPIGLPPGWCYGTTDVESQGDKIREAWPAIADLDWYGLGGDDQVPITEHWDLRYLEALNGANLVSCNDDWAIHGDERHPEGRVAGFICLSGPLLRALHWQVFPPWMFHTCLDDVYEHLDRLEPCRVILRDVLIKHEHFQNGGAQHDETYNRAYGEYGTQDEGRWRVWRDEQAAADAQIIKELKAKFL